MRGLIDRQHSSSGGNKGKSKSKSKSSGKRKAPTSLRGSSSDTVISAVDRSSFASDHDLLLLKLAPLSSGNPDPDPNKTAATALHKNTSFTAAATHKVKQKEQLQSESEEAEEPLDPSTHSFSHALKECQKRRLRSEPKAQSSFPKRIGRPASFDLYSTAAATATDAAIISPRFLQGRMKKCSTSSSSNSKTCTFSSPGTPNYRYHKGWSSERVPLPANSSRGTSYMAAVLPFNNARAIPSKWEDAEKWIFSPVGNENSGRSSVPPPHHRRPKSKSGPLRPHAYMSSSSGASPLNPCFNSGRVGGYNNGISFLTRIVVADSGSSGRGGNVVEGGDGGRSSSNNAEPYILRSASVHGWLETGKEPCSPFQSSQDEQTDPIRNTGTMLHSSVLRKDASTQMSPDRSACCSPEKKSLSSSSLGHPIEEMENEFPKLEVRDVQVDDRVTVTRWSKKRVTRGSDKRSISIIEWKKKTMETKCDTSSPEVAQPARCISKYKREEAKITLWENLQKAKAEAEIRKLEMKLEKKRSSSMDKIMNKLRSAQRKAQEMRSAVNTSQSQQIANGTAKRGSYFSRTGQISSLSGCFICPAF